MLSTHDISSIFKVSPRTVIRWIKSGKLRAYKTGKDYRIDPEDLEAFKTLMREEAEK